MQRQSASVVERYLAAVLDLPLSRASVGVANTSFGTLGYACSRWEGCLKCRTKFVQRQSTSVNVNVTASHTCAGLGRFSTSIPRLATSTLRVAASVALLACVNLRRDTASV
jgi:hypothetical protein